MKKLLALLSITILSVFATACDYENSITGLRFPADLQIHCTTFSINKSRGLWLTANHCVSNKQVYLVNGQEATVFLFDDSNDVAILYAPKSHAQAMPFCNTPPEKGDDIFISGHSYGWDERTYLTGIVAAPIIRIPDWTPNGDTYRRYMVFAVDGVAPGNSGSPVFKDKCGVISVLQSKDAYSGLSAGITWEALKTFTEGSWDRRSNVIEHVEVPSVPSVPHGDPNPTN